MVYFLVALALALHVAFWGAGLASLAMPRPWQRFWPILVMPAGFALQSAVVWAGAMAGLEGTRTYAWVSLLLPLAVLIVAWSRHGFIRPYGELRRFGAVWAVTGICLVFLVLPLVVGFRGLTTVSLGSCDAADYAAGARVLMEFARTDREGFLGLAEVVRVHSVDNFFDYWLRLNHFTPAALIALNGSVLDCAPHELTTVLTMLLLAGSVPVVFWMARAVIGLRGSSAVVVALLYGMSPVTWYAVGHVAPAQLLAALGIALITWSAISVWRLRRRGAAGWRLSGVLAGGYWLILGSYNFILLVCLVPAVTYVGLMAVRRREVPAFGRWAGMVLTPLLAVAGLFYGRIAGLLERITLLRTYDFGWRIPMLTPEGWLGFVGVAPALGAMAPLWQVVLGVVFGTVVVIALRSHMAIGWRAASVAIPALAGYGYLEARGALLGTNASYDAYKLLAVFFPGILAASLIWLRWLGRKNSPWRGLALVLLTLILLAHLRSVSQFYHALKSAPLRVTLALRDVRKIEAMPDVTSLNLLIPDMWSRLWANTFLLRKAQYFATHTYEARRNTELKGEWDLVGGLIEVRLPAGESRRVSSGYGVIRRASPLYLRAAFGRGWHAEEENPETGERWRWSQPEPELTIDNPQSHALRVRLVLDAQSVGPRELAAHAGAQHAPAVLLPDGRAEARLGPFVFPPGRSTITLRSPQPSTRVPGDVRLLGINVRRIQLEVLGP